MQTLTFMLKYKYFISWSWEKTFPGGWVVGSAWKKANSAQLERALAELGNKLSFGHKAFISSLSKLNDQIKKLFINVFPQLLNIFCDPGSHGSHSHFFACLIKRIRNAPKYWNAKMFLIATAKRYVYLHIPMLQPFPWRISFIFCLKSFYFQSAERSILLGRISATRKII